MCHGIISLFLLFIIINQITQIISEPQGGRVVVCKFVCPHRITAPIADLITTCNDKTSCEKLVHGECVAIKSTLSSVVCTERNDTWGRQIDYGQTIWATVGMKHSSIFLTPPTLDCKRRSSTNPRVFHIICIFLFVLNQHPVLCPGVMSQLRLISGTGGRHTDRSLK